jgi:exonuclease III
MTYNVLHHNFQYSANTYKYAEIISDVAPDVLALQEVIDREIFNNLKTLTGMSGEMFRTHRKNQGIGRKENGLGIMWNPALGYPAINTKKLLPHFGEQVGYIVAEFGNFCVVCSHYPVNMNGHEASLRIQTTKKILKDKVVNKCKNSGKAIYIAGDFNAEPDDASIKLFEDAGFKVLNRDKPEMTGPNGNQIDLIIEYNEYPNHKTLEQGTPDITGENPSDHKPYFVKVIVQNNIVGALRATPKQRYLQEIVPQGRDIINRRLQPTDRQCITTLIVPQGRHLIVL